MNPAPVLPPKDWSAGTVVICASGPSLTREDVEACAGHRMIVVNATYQMNLNADVLYAADSAFLNEYWQRIKKSFKGEVWSCSEDSRQRLKTKHVKVIYKAGLSRTHGTIYGGGNSGYQSIGLAAMWGARRIVLLGFDFQRTNEMEHWHGAHELPLHNGKNFPVWIDSMNAMAADLKLVGIEVINASRVTALKCFRRATIAEALA